MNTSAWKTFKSNVKSSTAKKYPSPLNVPLPPAKLVFLPVTLKKVA